MADNMIRCPEGHFYDPAKHHACPWCALPADKQGSEKTRPVPAGPTGQHTPPPLPGAAAPAPPTPAGPQPGVTRRLSLETGGARSEPVIGWLVCLEGPDRGRDFRLHAEKNFIGRAPHMDVCIPSDDSVSRDKHGVLVFDPKKQTFWILPGDAAGLVYLNGEIVHTPAQMKRDDVVEVGKTKLVLIPFCDDRYNWTAEAPATIA